MAARFEINSKAGQFNWVLKSQGRTLATGESYARRASAEKAIDSLRKAVASAPVADLTLRPATRTQAKATKAGPAKTAKTATKGPTRAGARKAAGTKKAGNPKKRSTKSA
jgi:uncharacterized protein YegP (UPF0339 family)